MKKRILLLSVILTGMVLSSFKPVLVPRLYPELEAYFKSIDVKQFEKSHLAALENIRENVNISNMDYDDWNVVFYCTENAFRSQASQVFLQTLCYANRFKRINTFSAGKTSSEVSPRLIAYLSKIGYRITSAEKNGIAVYEVKFSDNADPVILFSKTITDKSLPAKDVISVIVCDSKKEINCKDIQTASTLPFQLPFEKIVEADAEEKVHQTLKSIATEMVYVTQKKN